MIKNILASFIIIASFFAFSIYAAKAGDLPRGNFKQLEETSKGRVEEIIDPLTIRLSDDRLISLTGLDYPDLDYYAPGNFSIVTLKILKDFLLDQDIIIYQTKAAGLGRITRMNHALAHVVRKSDGTWIQGFMLSLGLARVRTTKYNPEMAEQMYAYENMARIAKTGIWAVKGFQILNADNAEGTSGSFQVVEGEITKVALQKNRLFLNFGKNWKTDFTVSISPTNKRIFANQNLDPQQWSGKVVRVRGWMESYNGPYIEVDHPQQFELLFLNDPVPQPVPLEQPTLEDEPSAEEIFETNKPSIIKRGSALPE